MARILELQNQGFFSPSISAKAYQECESEAQSLEHEINNLIATKIDSHEEEKLLFIECLAIERKLYYNFFTRGHFSDRTYHRLIDKIEDRYYAIKSNTLHTTDIDFFGDMQIQKFSFNKLLEHLPIFKAKTSRVALNYKFAWGQQQGNQAVISHINKIQILKSQDSHVIDTVNTVYQKWETIVDSRLHSIAEQFPEFVNHMQKRLAERVVIFTEIAGLEKQIISGTIPRVLAEELKNEINSKLRYIRENPRDKIILTSSEIGYRENKILTKLPENEFKIVSNLLQLKIIPLGSVIIEKNTTSHSMYFISRGVISLSIIQDNQEKRLATLLAGDCFGLILPKFEKTYPVTCQAVTPCALAELTYKDFYSIRATCPVFSHIIEQAIHERFTLMQKQDTFK